MFLFALGQPGLLGVSGEQIAPRAGLAGLCGWLVASRVDRDLVFQDCELVVASALPQLTP
jgi:hypothetical protein